MQGEHRLKAVLLPTLRPPSSRAFDDALGRNVHPAPRCNIAKAPYDWITKQRFSGSEFTPNPHLPPQVRGWQVSWWRSLKSVLGKVLEG